MYALITEIPCVFLLYDNKFWSSVFLIFIFSVSVWNGAGFYIEVFGRKCVSRLDSSCRTGPFNLIDRFCRFERELESLRKELAESEAHRQTGSGSGRSTPGGAGTESPAHSEDESASASNSPLRMAKSIPSDQKKLD